MWQKCDAPQPKQWCTEGAGHAHAETVNSRSRTGAVEDISLRGPPTSTRPQHFSPELIAKVNELTSILICGGSRGDLELLLSAPPYLPLSSSVISSIALQNATSSPVLIPQPYDFSQPNSVPPHPCVPSSHSDQNVTSSMERAAKFSLLPSRNTFSKPPYSVNSSTAPLNNRQGGQTLQQRPFPFHSFEYNNSVSNKQQQQQQALPRRLPNPHGVLSRNIGGQQNRGMRLFPQGFESENESGENESNETDDLAADASFDCDEDMEEDDDNSSWSTASSPSSPVCSPRMSVLTYTPYKADYINKKNFVPLCGVADAYRLRKDAYSVGDVDGVSFEKLTDSWRVRLSDLKTSKDVQLHYGDLIFSSCVWGFSSAKFASLWVRLFAFPEQLSSCPNWLAKELMNHVRQVFLPRGIFVEDFFNCFFPCVRHEKVASALGLRLP